MPARAGSEGDWGRAFRQQPEGDCWNQNLGKGKSQHAPSEECRHDCGSARSEFHAARLEHGDKALMAGRISVVVDLVVKSRKRLEGQRGQQEQCKQQPTRPKPRMAFGC